MYWSNYHSHNTFCDGRASMEDFIRFAIAKNIRKYGFSSHAPLPFHTKWTMPKDDFADYQKEFERLKRKYKDRIELFIGLEIDYVHKCSDAKKPFFTEKNLDYRIGSIHYLNKISENNYWSIDGGFDEFDAGLKLLYNGDIKEATQRYFEMSKLMIENGGFDIVGHFDKITMHGMQYPEFNIHKKWFTEPLEETLDLIKKKNLILEINTKSLPTLGVTYPNQEFYALINNMQIPIVVNSDCHYPTNVITGFEETYTKLKKAGFKTMHQLIAGKWQPVEFDERGLKY